VDWSGIIFKSVDVSIPLTIGDAAENLRGALDYLDGVLVREQGNDPVAAKTQCPILETQGRDKSGATKPVGCGNSDMVSSELPVRSIVAR
jgi:hypothetical protein